MIGYKAKRLDRWRRTQSQIRRWMKTLEINQLNQQRRIREHIKKFDTPPEIR